MSVSKNNNFMNNSKTTHYTKEIFVKDYFDIHNHYTEIYKGSNCNILILMQVGSFHECYNTDTDGPNLHVIGEKLDMIVTQKNKSKPLCTSNPRMMGFPSYIVEEVMDKIISIGYTIVRIDQTSEPPNPKREVVGIYSPSTHINNNNNINNNIVCITIDGLKLKTSTPLLLVGMACYNMMTGEGCVYETISTIDDTMLALDNTVRFMEKYPPSEVVTLYSKNIMNYFTTNKHINHMTMDDIMKYIGITMTTYTLNNIDILTNAKYQENIIIKTFNDTLDSINLHAYNMARLALVGILEFTSNHMPLLLEKLNKPKYFDQTNSLYLGNKAIDQLDVMPSQDKTKTLYSILCKTRTPMGKRLLKDNLCNPVICSDVLNIRYDTIEMLMENNICEKIYNSMINIMDLPKLVRRMELKKIYPSEMASFYNSFIVVRNTINIINNNNIILNIMKQLNININLLENIENIITTINTTFNIDYITNINYINYKEETFNYILNKNVSNYKKIEELTDGITMGNNFMEHLVKILVKYVEEKNPKVIKKDTDPIILKYNDRDGHYMLLTKRRSKILRDNLKEIPTLKIGTHIIKTSDLEFLDLPRSNNTKICCKEIQKISIDVVELKSILAQEIKEAFYYHVNVIIMQNKLVITNIIDFITMLDFMNSGALCSYNNGYTKPVIKEEMYSYFKAKQLRHPIVELLCNDTIYHPHDIELGGDTKNGILLYGINSSGKSTLMKSIGLAIIMAQIGYYVPATEFIFSPYHNIFTRIVGVDNIFRGMSSFMVEMMELMAILKRNNMKTLVLGDEICRGTEEKSANIIVAYMLETLTNSNTSFITATHLHSIALLPSVQNLKKLNIMHLKINYDEAKDILIYNRDLLEGMGDKYYGVMVAKYMMKNDHFNNRTKELEMEYEDYTVKKSNYNKDVLMISCHICMSTKKLETHHINFQKDCDKIKVVKKPHIKKNKAYNLVVLCSKCHDLIDSNNIVVNGWIDTSNGITLDWYKV